MNSGELSAQTRIQMKKMELVFIPWPGISHFSSTLQFAHLLLRRDHRLSVTVLLIPPPWEAIPAALLHSLHHSRIRFLTLPEHPIPADADITSLFKAVIETQKQNVRDAVANLPDSPTIAGFVIDMFCTALIGVAKELGVPSYVFYTASAGYLSFTSHLQELYDRHNKQSDQFLRLDFQFAVPGFTNPVPGNVIPSSYFNTNSEWIIHEGTRRLKESSGILINTFSELESQVLDAFPEPSGSSQCPPVYAVGPILSLNSNNENGSGESSEGLEILKWLDQQPPSSVVFLCFGNWGSFNRDQVREIAVALERSGNRFVWSLRPPPSKRKVEDPIGDDYIKDVVPEGFLDRTAEIGRVIGRAPQVEILGHPATGGFVSHCGWNSTLESVWSGVPIGAWPIYAEQRLNAVEMEVELGLAVGISSETGVVSAEKIESGIRELMGGDGEVRKWMKVKSEESRRSVMEGGSSFTALNRFVAEVTAKANSL